MEVEGWLTAIAIGLDKAVVREIEQMGRKALALACEMANPSDIDRLVNKTYVQFGRCDVLVNNAGVTQDASPLMESTQQFFDQVQAVNVNGPMQLAIEIAKRMADSGGGSIINIVSTAALQPVGHMGACSASKAALRSLTAVMAEEWALMGIRVNAIAPDRFLPI
ncbi:MAG: SDR family NAD(P)-dependent oxidoreductase [Gammaproteobacteria bacterium]|nr:SDR family NAD(P)-dependent oxidoreductase [Gammaproteobacteria bacterium]